MGDTVPGMRVKVYDDTPEKAAEGFYNLQKMHIAQAQYAGAVLGRYSIVRAAYDEGSSAILPTQIVIGDLSGHFYRLRDTGDPFIAPESDTYDANGVGTHWDDLMLVGAADYSTQEKGIQDWKVERQYTHPVLVIGSDQLIYGSVDGGDLTDDPVNGNTDNWILYEKLAGPVPVIASQMRQWQISGCLINPNGPTDIRCSTGAARDFADSGDLIVSEELIKGFNEEWTEGNNEGGFPRGIGDPIVDQFYGVFLIGRVELDGSVTVDMGFDSDLTAANLLNNDNAGFKDFTLYRRIGYVQAETTSQLYAFHTDDDGMIVWDEMAGSGLLVPSTTLALHAVKAPANTTVNIHAHAANAGALALYILLTAVDQSSGTPDDTNFHIRCAGTGSGAQTGSANMNIRVDVNQQINYEGSNDVVSNQLYINTLGFYDSRDH